MPYIIETFDKPGHQAVRQQQRAAHLEYLDANKGLLLACGAKLQDDGADAGGGLYWSTWTRAKPRSSSSTPIPSPRPACSSAWPSRAGARPTSTASATCKPAARPRGAPAHAPDGIAAIRLHPRGTSMSYADLSQARLYYVIDGPADAPVLVLSNSLGTCADMWARGALS